MKVYPYVHKNGKLVVYVVPEGAKVSFTDQDEVVYFGKGACGLGWYFAPEMA